MNAPPPLYPHLLGAAWSDLPAAVRGIHISGGAPVRAAGTFRVRYGPTRAARCLARLLRLPAEGDGAEITLHVTPLRGGGERWERSFAGNRLASTQTAGPDGSLAERMGMVELRFRLEADADGLDYRAAGAALPLGPWRLPLPRRLSPGIEAREEADPDDPARARIRVEVTVPGVGVLLTYGGHVVPAAEHG